MYFLYFIYKLILLISINLKKYNRLIQTSQIDLNLIVIIIEESIL